MTTLKERIEASAHGAAEGMDVAWLLREQATRRPDDTALIWCPFDGPDLRMSYGESLAAAGRLAEGLRREGVRPGDFVLLHMDNAPEFVVAWYASALLGSVAVSTNTRSVARDMSYFADVTQAVCALTQPRFAELIREACPSLKFIAVTDDDAGTPRPDVDAVREATAAKAFDSLFADEPVAERAVDPELNLSVQFTSGTTSRPKAVLWTHANGIWAGKGSARHFRLRSDDVTLAYMPMFHTNAQGYSMLATHWSGGTLVLQPKFSASRFWDVVTGHGVTWASMIPFAIKALLKQPVPEHRMRLWPCGARIPQFEEHFGVTTLGLWGMTETLTQGIVVDPDHLGPAGTIGRAATGYEIEVRRPDGASCDAEEKGRLYIRGVRGVSLFKEYYRNPDANAAAFDDQGWFDTGDVVRRDAEGWLYFSDRDKDMLKVGAENVAASEVEVVVMQTGLCAECAVVGQRHHMLDEVPVAFVIPNEAGAGLAADDLERRVIAHCEANLPDFKVVRSVHVVDELPRSTLEKVAKNVLRDRLEPITEGR